jgi:hypothetical protein
VAKLGGGRGVGKRRLEQREAGVVAGGEAGRAGAVYGEDRRRVQLAQRTVQRRDLPLPAANVITSAAVCIAIKRSGR